MSVTADDPRYDAWPSRKPGKTAKLAAKLRDRPLELAAEEASKHAARSLRTKGHSTLKRAAAAIPLAAAGTAAASASILAAAYLVGDRIARNGQLKLGDRVNAISLRFTETQRQLEQAFGTTRWEGVPADLRAKAVRDYKAAIATATSRAQGTAFAGTRAEGSYK